MPMPPGFADEYREMKNARNESGIRSHLRNLVRSATGEYFEPERRIARGFGDMVSDRYRVIIEVKGHGKANPNAGGGGRDKNNKAQLDRYLDGIFEAEKAGHPNAEPLEDAPWRGFLTDGVHWWGYEAGQEGGSAPLAGSARECPEAQALHDYLREFVAPAHRKHKPPPPDNLIDEVFAPFLARVQKLLRQYEDQAFYRTKLTIWHETLSRAGLTPPEGQTTRTAELFARHTTLVAAARILKTILQGEAADDAAAIEAVRDGFPAWLVETREGPSSVLEMTRRLREYNWRGDTRDRLKEAYHHFIDVRERKEFGEYYTPDWLAKKMVEQALDKTWLDEAVQKAARVVLGEEEEDNMKALAVLDPSCGSGTFLFHAARKVRSHINETRPDLAPHARAMVSRMTVGIDVHPIAIEMARATLEMALPPQDGGGGDVPLQVFLGDAMQSDRVGYGGLPEAGTTISIVSSDGRILYIPKSMLLHARADHFIDALNDEAVKPAEQQTPLHFPELPDADREDIQGAQQKLTEIIHSEANHVWAWHLRNKAGLVRLSTQKAGRIIGNPPWLAAYNTPDGERKKTIEKMRKNYGISVRIRGSSAKGDLASVFSARVMDLYLAEGDRMALVLPGSALKNQTWAPWRSGDWKPCKASFELAWNLDALDPPVFGHNPPNGTCAVFARRTEAAEALDTKHIGHWSGDPDNPTVQLKALAPNGASPYHGRFLRGAVAQPHGLLYVLAGNATPLPGKPRGRVQVTTKVSSKGPWKGIFREAVVEARALLPLATSKGLVPFHVEADASLIAPREKVGGTHVLLEPGNRAFKKKYPETYRYWRDAEQTYQEKRSPNSGSTLSENLDRYRTLSNQLDRSAAQARPDSQVKVFYNKSGTKLRAARGPASLPAADKLYWLIARNGNEALYLVGIINAPCMQNAWRENKTSSLDFDKSPWKSIPVPLYDAKNPKHRAVVQAARRAEKQFGNAERQALDKAVRTLLPDHAAAPSSGR